MDCRVIYDLANGFWLDIRVQMWVMLGLVGTIVPIALIVAAQFPLLRRIGRLPGRVQQVALAILACAAIVASSTGILKSHSKFVAVRDSYLHGHFTTLTGPIENFRDETFHPMIPGEFTVRGHTFTWDPSGNEQRFFAGSLVNRFGPISYAPQFEKPLHDGMTVRLRFMNDRITRIEAPASELPFALAAGAAPCDSSL